MIRGTDDQVTTGAKKSLREIRQACRRFNHRNLVTNRLRSLAALAFSVMSPPRHGLNLQRPSLLRIAVTEQ
jgi:hypothetical protein